MHTLKFATIKKSFIQKIRIPGKLATFTKLAATLLQYRQARAEHTELVQHYRENAVKLFSGCISDWFMP